MDPIYLGLYLDTSSISKGEIGFYIDEYDRDGNWVSGKWMGSAKNSPIREYYFVYTPSSSNVSQFVFQIYVGAMRRGEAYFDNFRIYSQGLEF